MLEVQNAEQAVAAALAQQTKRKDDNEVVERVSMDPEDKDILYMQAQYKHDRLKDLREVAGPQPESLLPSDRFWGRFEKMKRDSPTSKLGVCTNCA